MTSLRDIPSPWHAPITPLPTHAPLWHLWLPLALFLAAVWAAIGIVVWWPL
jgi:hypothetical protein